MIADRKGRTKKAGLASAVVAGAMLIAACGSSASGSSASGKSGGKSGGTVHFAAIGPLTGSYSALGIPIAQGTKAAALVINKAGGILGKKLVVDPVDTHGDPADAVTALNQEIALNHPAVLVGPITLEIHAVQPIFDRNQIPDGWNGGSATYNTNTDQYLWRCNPSDTQEGVAIADYAITKGYKRAAMLFSTSAASQSFEPIIASAYKALGGTIVKTESITPNLSSYASEMSAIVSAHPQVIFTQMEPGTSSAAFKNIEALGALNIPWVGTDFMTGQTVIDAIGPAISKAHMVELEGSSKSFGPGASQFNSSYQTANGTAPQSGGNYAYDCTIDFALAITKAKSFSGPAIIKEMKAVSNPPGTACYTYASCLALLKKGVKINYQGVSGPMDYNKYNNVTGAWDVVQSTGAKSGAVRIITTLTGPQIQAVLNKIGAANAASSG